MLSDYLGARYAFTTRQRQRRGNYFSGAEGFASSEYPIDLTVRMMSGPWRFNARLTLELDTTVEIFEALLRIAQIDVAPPPSSRGIGHPLGVM